MDDDAIRTIVRRVLADASAPTQAPAPEAEWHKIPLEVSARHIHLTEEALCRLFGEEAELGVVKALSQPGEFLSDKRVKLITSKGEIANVSVLGPVRKAIQVELSATDCRALGLNAPVNLSGNLNNAADVVILGDSGLMEAPCSVIIAKAHVHLTKADAVTYGVVDGQSVRVRVEGARPVTFDDVIVRVKDSYKAACHLDTDEGNACAAGAAPVAFLSGGESGCLAGALHKQACPLSWSEYLINEKTAKKLAAIHAGDKVFFYRGATITPAARDVLNEARIAIEYVNDVARHGAG